jgi:hypothetical protein
MLLQMNAKILKIYKNKTRSFCRTVAVLCIASHHVNVRKHFFQIGGAVSCSDEVTAHFKILQEILSISSKNDGSIKARNKN